MNKYLSILLSCTFVSCNIDCADKSKKYPSKENIISRFINLKPDELKKEAGHIAKTDSDLFRYSVRVIDEEIENHRRESEIIKNRILSNKNDSGISLEDLVRKSEESLQRSISLMKKN